MKKIAFNVSNFSFRGSEIALFDYAFFNVKLLNNISIIVTPSDGKYKNNDVKKKFTNEFPIFYYDSLTHLEEICRNQEINYLYTIKYGKNDGIVLQYIPTIVHCVFTATEPHGSVYAGVSKSVASTGNNVPFVNHMVYLPDIKSDYRKELNIPENAIVFGRHGGEDTFNISFVKDAILQILSERNDIYFIFAVKPLALKEVTHPRILYLQSFVDMRIKTKFINTCDAMIHACSLGESFGLSILEFCHQNKPVITWNDGLWHKQHHMNLGSKGIYYSDKNSLLEIFRSFKKGKYDDDYKSLVLPFTPEKIMKEFEDVFLKTSVTK